MLVTEVVSRTVRSTGLEQPSWLRNVLNILGAAFRAGSAVDRREAPLREDLVCLGMDPERIPRQAF